MAATSSGVYDFYADNSNADLWKGLLQPALRKIQKQVHPRLDIDEDASAYLERLIYCLLAQMCSAQLHTISDVEAYVQKNFTAPIDTWALSDAQLVMDRAQKKRGVFIFPVDKLFTLLQKEVFGYKIELNLVQYIMAILDYVSADILKLAGTFVKNIRKPAVIIQSNDIKVSISADPALQALIQPLQGGQAHGKDLHIENYNNEISEGKLLTYDQLLRQLIDEESQYVRHLNLILKVFMEPFGNRKLFLTADVERIFGNLIELHELSVKLLGDLDDCIEMSGEMVGDSSVPQAGIIFEDLAESFEFEVYTRYAENYMEAKCALEEVLADQEVVRHFKSSKTKLFKEAMQYILPNSLLEPVYHFFHYFEVMELLLKTSPTVDDTEAFESAITCAMSIKMEMERVCSRFLPKRKDGACMFGRGQGYGVAMRKVGQIQQKIEAWEGPDILSCCSKLIKEGSLNIIKDSGRRAQKTERHVFLLDGLAVCCKAKSRGVGEYRFKEKINMKKAELIDLDDADDLKYAFQLVGQDQPAITFYAISKLDKNEWMAALTLLLTRSTFDRLLDSKLREEDQNIAVLTPDPTQYIFAEEDSDENILFDEVEAGKPSGGPGPPIKAGTINKLVERLTFHEYADPSFVRTFLMTYRSFSEPHELLGLLIARFQIPMPVDTEDPELRRDPNTMKAVKRYKTTFISPIQLRVLNVLRHWVEVHYYDFERHPELLEKLRTFVGSIKPKSMQKWVLSINRSLQKKDTEKPSAFKHVFNSRAEPIEWHIAKTKDEYHILTLHPVEVARQLTLIQSEYFRAIHPSELVDASWMKDEKKEKASPNLLKLNRFETTMSNWLVKEIVLAENLEERVAVVSRLIDIMEELLHLNNFAGMFVVNAALESASVFRLKSTFIKALHQKRNQVLLAEMKEIASSYKGYKNYKEKLRTINPPCVPFLGMYMTWIVFIRDGSENKISGKAEQFINFKKRRKIADVLQEIQQYQNSPYCITLEQSMQDWILSQDPVGSMTNNQWEDHIFEMSRSIEPKDQPVKKVPRQHTFDLKPPQDRSAFGTFRSRNKPKPIPSHSVEPSPGVDGEPSPSASSTPPSPRFFGGSMENGGSGNDDRKSSSSSLNQHRGRTTSNPPAHTPPRPPKLPPKNSPSMSSLPPIPHRGHSPPVTGGGQQDWTSPRKGPKPPDKDRKISNEKPMQPLPPNCLPNNEPVKDKNTPPLCLPKPTREPNNNLRPPPTTVPSSQPPRADVPPLPPKPPPPVPKREGKQVATPPPPRPPKNT